MKQGFEIDSCKLSFEKASELGKTLGRGGVALADNATAFTKKCVTR